MRNVNVKTKILKAHCCKRYFLTYVAFSSSKSKFITRLEKKMVSQTR